MAYAKRKRMILVTLGSALLNFSTVGASLTDRPPSSLTRYSIVAIHPQPDDTGTGEAQYSNSTADGILLRGATLESLLASAFGILPDQIIGIPHSISGKRYDVTARVDVEELPVYQKMTAIDKRVMLQSLLADRFGLIYHHELKPLRVYELVSIKGKPTPQSALSDHFRLSVGRGHLEAKNAPVSALIEVLSAEVGRVVLDKTGLQGRYDFGLSWDPEDSQLKAAPSESEQGPGDARADKASLFRALVEQLGLRLEAKTDGVDALVVDHIAQPTEN